MFEQRTVVAKRENQFIEVSIVSELWFAQLRDMITLILLSFPTIKNSHMLSVLVRFDSLMGETSFDTSPEMRLKDIIPALYPLVKLVAKIATTTSFVPPRKMNYLELLNGEPKILDLLDPEKFSLIAHHFPSLKPMMQSNPIYQTHKYGSVSGTTFDCRIPPQAQLRAFIASILQRVAESSGISLATIDIYQNQQMNTTGMDDQIQLEGLMQVLNDLRLAVTFVQQRDCVSDIQNGVLERMIFESYRDYTEISIVLQLSQWSFNALLETLTSEDSKIEKITLSNTAQSVCFSTEQFGLFCKALQHNRSVKKIVIVGKWTGSELNRLFASVNKSSSLQTVILGASVVMKGLPSSPLAFGNKQTDPNLLVNVAMQAKTQRVSLPSTIQKLQVQGCRTALGVQYIMPYYSNSSPLQELKISDSVAPNLDNLYNLQKLAILGGPFDTSVIKCIANNKKLETLSLQLEVELDQNVSWDLVCDTLSQTSIRVLKLKYEGIPGEADFSILHNQYHSNLFIEAISKIQSLSELEIKAQGKLQSLNILADFICTLLKKRSKPLHTLKIHLDSVERDLANNLSVYPQQPQVNQTVPNNICYSTLFTDVLKIIASTEYGTENSYAEELHLTGAMKINDSNAIAAQLRNNTRVKKLVLQCIPSNALFACLATDRVLQQVALHGLLGDKDLVRFALALQANQSLQSGQIKLAQTPTQLTLITVMGILRGNTRVKSLDIVVTDSKLNYYPMQPTTISESVLSGITYPLKFDTASRISSSSQLWPYNNQENTREKKLMDLMRQGKFSDDGHMTVLHELLKTPLPFATQQLSLQPNPIFPSSNPLLLYQQPASQLMFQNMNN